MAPNPLLGRSISIATLLVGFFCSGSNSQPTTSASAEACACGYLINSTASPTHALFTEILETDFTHLRSLSSNPCWQSQQYNQTAAAGRGSFGKEATLRNVVANPFASAAAWEGSGVQGGDAGLQLWVSAEVMDERVAIGEVASMEREMMYGSFRVGMKLNGVPGTCGAFFYYASDSQEIDMEFLSSNFNAASHPVYLIMQTPESVAAGYNAAGTSTYNVHQLSFSPTEQFHEYRFDWTPDKVSFYVDSQWIQDLSHVYPQKPGHISMNHWSNGNSAWSRGPPSEDAVITVAYVKAYYNTTDSDKLTAYDKLCSTPEMASAMCQVPDQAAPGTDGFGQTHFFSRGMCEEDIATATAAMTVTAMVTATLDNMSTPVTTAITFTSTSDASSWNCQCQVQKAKSTFSVRECCLFARKCIRYAAPFLNAICSFQMGRYAGRFLS